MHAISIFKWSNINQFKKDAINSPTNERFWSAGYARYFQKRKTHTKHIAAGTEAQSCDTRSPHGLLCCCYIAQITTTHKAIRATVPTVNTAHSESLSESYSTSVMSLIPIESPSLPAFQQNVGTQLSSNVMSSGFISNSILITAYSKFPTAFHSKHDL